MVRADPRPASRPRRIPTCGNGSAPGTGPRPASASSAVRWAVDPLDQIPLDVLLALHEALAADRRVVRAAQRTRGEGLHVTVARPVESPVRYDPEPIPMEPAEDGVESLNL